MKNLWNFKTSRDYIVNFKKFGVNQDLALSLR